MNDFRRFVNKQFYEVPSQLIVEGRYQYDPSGNYTFKVLSEKQHLE